MDRNDVAVIAIMLIIAMLTTDAYGQEDCDWSWCNVPTAAPSLIPEPTNWFKILNKDKQRVGDIYNPGHGRRLQIRDKNRQIIGYIEADGRITDPDRQTVGSIADLNESKDAGDRE